jgi:hypothetical protein
MKMKSPTLLSLVPPIVLRTGQVGGTGMNADPENISLTIATIGKMDGKAIAPGPRIALQINHCAGRRGGKQLVQAIQTKVGRGGCDVCSFHLIKKSVVTKM